MIGIIDYGLSNLKSVASAIQKLDFEGKIISDVQDLKKVKKLILPGVGAFADGMNNLRRLNLIEPLTDMVVNQKKPILGICLGAQLMCQESFEFGHTKGLGWINASVVRFSVKEPLRVPHVGWNDLYQVKRSILFDEIPENALFYYVHSYYIKSHEEDIVVGCSDHGEKFTAVIHKDNIYATQFHPEKSQLYGLKLLKNFIEKG